MFVAWTSHNDFHRIIFQCVYGLVVAFVLQIGENGKIFVVVYMVMHLPKIAAASLNKFHAFAVHVEESLIRLINAVLLRSAELIVSQYNVDAIIKIYHQGGISVWIFPALKIPHVLLLASF